MAKEITVTFEDGGVFEGFANTYTLNNEVTYYFSFDRDYRVQATDNAITLQEYRNAGAWYPIDIITGFAVTEISGTGGDVTKEWVFENFATKSSIEYFITYFEADRRYQPKGNYVSKEYVDQNFITQITLNNTLALYLTIADFAERMKLYVKRSGDTMTGPLKFPKVWHETISAVGDLLPEVTLNTSGDFTTILSNENNGFAIYLDEDTTNKNYFTINLKGIKNDYLIAGLFDSDITTACIFKLGASLDTSAATFNILCAGGGSGREETLIESTNPVYLNNSFGLDGELKIKEFTERAEQADEIDTFITIHPKNATNADNEYPLISYGSEIIKYYLTMGNSVSFSTLQYNGLNADTLLLGSKENLVINAGNYWSMFSSRSTFYDSDAAYLHNNLHNIQGVVNSKTSIDFVTNNQTNLTYLVDNTDTIKQLNDNSAAIEATYTETFYSSSMLDALNNVINNMQETLGTYFYSEFAPDTFTGGGKSRGGGVGRHQTTE